MKRIQLRKTRTAPQRDTFGPVRPRVRANTTVSWIDHFKEMAEFPLYAILKVTCIHMWGRGHANETATATFSTVWFTLPGSHGPGLRTACLSLGPSPFSDPAAESFRCGCVLRASGGWVRLCARVLRLFASCVRACVRAWRLTVLQKPAMELKQPRSVPPGLDHDWVGGRRVGKEERERETRCHFLDI